MRYSAYVGRVGALAVALGIGSAVTGVQVAWADAGGQTGSGSPAYHNGSARAARTGSSLHTSGTAEHSEATRGTKKRRGGGATSGRHSTSPRAPKITTTTSPTKTEVAQDVEAGDVKVVISDKEAETRTTVKGTKSETKTKTYTDNSTIKDETVKELTVKDTSDEGSTYVYTDPGNTSSASSSTPTATVTVSSVAPSGSVVRPFHNLVLGVLGLFGFHPGSGASGNPILAGIWGTYRRLEAFFDNASPRIVSAQVVSTSLTTDGRTAVTLAVTTSDLDGDALGYSTKSGAHGTLTANTDGTFTYVADAGYTGTDTITITANDSGHSHFHGLLSFLMPNWGHTSTAKLSLTLTANTTPVDASTIIDSVTSTPGTGNTWTVTVTGHTADGTDSLHYTVTATEPDHVTVSATPTSGVYVVTVSDNDWATSNPGSQIMVTATADDGIHEAATSTTAIGTVNNAASLNIGTLDPASIPALPAGVTYTKAAGTGLTFELIRADGVADSVLTLREAGVGEATQWLSPDPLTTYAAIKRTSSGTIVLLRSDGQATAIAADGTIETQTIPALADGVTYTELVPMMSDIELTPSGWSGPTWAFQWADDGAIAIPPDGGVVLVGPQMWTLWAFTQAPVQLLLSDGSSVAIY